MYGGSEYTAGAGYAPTGACRYGEAKVAAATGSYIMERVGTPWVTEGGTVGGTARTPGSEPELLVSGP